MTVSLSIPANVIAQARALHDANLPDTCIIERPTGPAWDEDQQATIDGWETIWEGPCRWPDPSRGQPVIITGEKTTPIRPQVRVPWDVTGVQPDDRVTCTHSTGDPSLIGQEVWVDAVRARSLNASRLLDCRWLQ